MRPKYICWCRMVLHDNLYYASREFGRLYETEKYLHNYGLTYALGLVQPAPAYFHSSQEPHYQEELHIERVGATYVTPARPLKVDFAFVTFKMANVPYYSNTPRESKNRVLFGRAKELAPGSTFEFFILAEEKRSLPQWIRLGKWMAKAELTCKWFTLGSEQAKIVDTKQAQLISCPVNPMDIDQKRIIAFDVIVMPPASLLINARITGPCCKLLTNDDPEARDKGEKYIPLSMYYFNKDISKGG